MIGAVIFDMGNVLIDWDPHEAYRPHLPDAGGRVAFLGRYFRLMYDAVHDDPRPMGECLAPLKAEFPQYRHLIEVYERQWHLFLRGPMTDSVVLVERLHERGIPLYGLTNWPHRVWPPQATRGRGRRRSGGLRFFGQVQGYCGFGAGADAEARAANPRLGASALWAGS